MNAESTLIKIRNVIKEYRGLAGTVVALKGISLDVRQGEFLVITGKSGAGKTTLVNVLAGLDRTTGGEIWVDGAPVHRFGPEKAAQWRGQTVGVVFQTFELLPTLSLVQNVMLPMDFAHRYTRRQRRERAMQLAGTGRDRGARPQTTDGHLRRAAAARRHRPRAGERSAAPHRRRTDRQPRLGDRQHRPRRVRRSRCRR